MFVYMRECYSCKQIKPLTEFCFRNKEKGTYQTSCNPCNRKYTRKYYQKNKKYFHNKARTWEKQRFYENQLKLLDFLSNHPCVDCKENDPIVLQFDHIKGKKEMEVSKMIKSCNWTKISNEIDKCEVRCANCHTKKTAKSFSFWKTLIAQRTEHMIANHGVVSSSLTKSTNPISK